MMFNPLPVPPALLDFIHNHEKFIVSGHREPDGDCLGSTLALCSALKRLGKEAVPCSAGPFKRAEVKHLESLFCSQIDPGLRSGAAVIIVDCSSLERIGDLQESLRDLDIAMIDHHAMGQCDDANNEPSLLYIDSTYIDPAAPSVTFMILRLIEALGLVPTEQEASRLFFGLCTDTGFFRHIDSSGAETFAAASALIRAGANPKTTFQLINGGKSLDSRILLGKVLSRAESYYEGRLIVSTELYEETQRFGAEGRDSDMLYQLFQSVAGVEAIVILRQESPDNCTIGFRSRDEVNVAEIAHAFGGGGHKNAAGLSISGLIEELKPQIIAAFLPVFSK
ncbi:phosphoesterase [Spirochaetia bacterium]|nr:phosphoesterase [Spirochaetia bacterium]